MNEKKIRRDIRLWKIASAVCMIGALVGFGFGFYYQDSWIANKTVDYWKLQVFVFSLFSLAVGLACGVLSCLCLVLQRQGEHTLFLKETLSTRKEHPIVDPWR